MKFSVQAILSKEDKIQILELWNNEYPENLSFTSIAGFEDYLNTLSKPIHHLIINADNKIKGWSVGFFRDGKKWFAMILDTAIHGQRWGTELLDRMKEGEVELSGWVIDHSTDRKNNGENYKSPLNFYLKNGFEIFAEERLELDKISAVKIKWKKKPVKV